MSGIQTLLKAEKEAHEIVSEARQYRTQRLKAAKADAAADIEAYKQKKDQELKKFEQEHSGYNEKAEKEAEQEVGKELKEIKKAAEEKKSSVCESLIDSVVKPTPEMHVNA